MKSLLACFAEIRAVSPNPAQPFSLRNYVGGFVHFPVSMDRFLRFFDRGFPAQLGGDYALKVNTQDMNSDTLVGLADIHTHPAANYGFGTELFFGDFQYELAYTLNYCGDYHGFRVDNWLPPVQTTGNIWRQQIVDTLCKKNNPSYHHHNYNGSPDFPVWPTWWDPVHQQVHVDMLERAYLGGLRLLVALAVNNHTLAKAGGTLGPYDDQTSGDLQIGWLQSLQGLTDFHGNLTYPWLEIAYSPKEMRQIIGEGKLAIILGVELDCIGNFYSPVNTDSGNRGGSFHPEPTNDDIRAEVSRLFAQGVRYFFPVHVVDNVFGGAAFYDTQFDLATRFQTGSWIAKESAPAASKINYQADDGPSDVFGALGEWALAKVNLGFDPNNVSSFPWPTPVGFTGWRNARELTPRGQVLLDALMRAGAMIDVDHMCEKTVIGTLAYTSSVPLSSDQRLADIASQAEVVLPPAPGDVNLPPGVKYPLFAGHNFIRDSPGNERAHLITVATEILNRGGVFGIGLTQDLAKVHTTISELRDKQSGSQGGGIAFGSDCSGLSQLPAPNQNQGNLAHDVYDDGQHPEWLTQYHLINRAEDIVNNGFSHIGMYPDFIEQGVLSNDSNHLTDDDVTELFNAPEAVASAWQACVDIAGQMK